MKASEGAEIPFDNVLDRVTRSDPTVTDYILQSPAKCPKCKCDILEKTLIEPTRNERTQTGFLHLWTNLRADPEPEHWSIGPEPVPVMAHVGFGDSIAV